MTHNINDNSIVLTAGELELSLLKTGDFKQLICEGIMINQLIGNSIETMPSNLYLRIKSEEGYQVYPLLGAAAKNEFAILDDQVVFRGKVSQIQYMVYFTLTSKQTWFYDIFLENQGEIRQVDLIYTQDIGLAAKAHIRSNEAYNSQYIDHRVFETEEGYVVCSRQNQEQPTGFPFLQQGSFQKVKSFSTDGYLFYGLLYKFDNRIKELWEDRLNNRVYQYEFAYTALQAEPILLEKAGQFTFYGSFLGDLKTNIEKPIEIEQIRAIHDSIEWKESKKWKKFLMNLDVNQTITSLPFTSDEVRGFYPIRRHEEEYNGKLLSFFKETNEYVVLMEKEKYVERSHGHIIITGDNDYIREDVLASTSYIFGVFNSQVVVGNTSFHKLNSNCRNGLNVSKAAGQRVMIKIDGEYRLLTMPAVYELGFNYAKWIYKLEDDCIELISYTMLDRPILNFELKSQNHKLYDLIIYSQICNAPDEYEQPVHIQRNGRTLVTKHGNDTVSAKVYPDLEFVMTMDQDFDLYDDSRFYMDGKSHGEPMMVLEMKQISNFKFITEARIDGKPIESTNRSFEDEVKVYRDWLKAGIHNFNLSIPGNDRELQSKVERFNDLSLWYSHNARIHYCSPHGLEQYGGAAWGTRDVCQGPIEYFIAVQNFNVVRDILRRIYEHQFIEDGSWSQWFMFDGYQNVQAGESHGDVIVWPLKALSLYLSSSGDYHFLDQEFSYMTRENCTPTQKKETIYLHAKKQIAYIKEHFIAGTSLSCYGDGDWDDTLQPANPQLRENMVSGWTVTLTYQVMKDLAKVFMDYDRTYATELDQIAENIKTDYHSYIIKDGVVSGFILFEEGSKERIKYLLHPMDKETGLTYRLLPMTRSMISGMFTSKEVEEHYRLIKKYLYHPDGVRLMDTTCRYTGGTNTYFKRAETAANFGREVGLNYIHAHIRFIEAMAEIGNAEDAWEGLLQVNPIKINSIVKNANIRQSNCYFSSSDGAFDNRYEAMKDFHKLLEGEITVKSGWRIYSSGSGIYLHQLISNCLGIKIKDSQVIIDPVLPTALDGLSLEYAILGKSVKIYYHISKNCGVTKVLVDQKEVIPSEYKKKYREGGICFEHGIIKDNSRVDVYL